MIFLNITFNRVVLGPKINGKITIPFNWKSHSLTIFWRIYLFERERERERCGGRSTSGLQAECTAPLGANPTTSRPQPSRNQESDAQMTEPPKLPTSTYFRQEKYFTG